MKKTRIKVHLPTIATREDAEACVGAVALLTLAQIETTAKMDAEIAAARQRYESQLGEMAATLNLETDKLRAWAEANPDQFPKGRKSIQFVQGTIGFRTGTPKLALLNRSWSWKKVLEAIKQQGMDKLGFIRSTPEVDKEYILASHSKAKQPELHVEGVLKPVGLKIAQDESFYIEPNLTEVETRHQVQTTEVA